MKNLNDTLPELMRRATENLEPESSDLVERGMARGATLRRRRTALVSFSGAAAVLATAGIIVSGSQLFAKDAEPPAASTPTKQSATNTGRVAAKPATLKETQATLTKLLPPRLKVAKVNVWDDGGGHQADLSLNDGKGLSLISLAIRPAIGQSPGCSDQKPGTCVTRPDGSRLTVVKDEFEKRTPGVVYNHIYLVRTGGESISLSSYNGNTVTREGAVTVEKTRAAPALTAAELTAIADSDLWRFPAKPVESTTSEKPQPPSPGASKPAVPVQQTLQTLKSVLPKGLQVSQPKTRGGLPADYNAASVLVNDGKGLSYVEVFITYQAMTVKKCGVEGAPNHCTLRADGSVAGWDKNSPEYSESRQDKEGVLGNTAAIHFPDGRYITLTSYNAVAEKGSKHTRPKPAISAEKLLDMAGNKAWKFPGTK
ncbi:hypothetical protein AB0P21_11790 [Kribbella sp. NPDC056861]|uniref:hypothetical protein n=1 Tax=Kribbella sp. NPDC056861 TaxID=3154857 RepID=UPI0034486B2A